MRDVSLGSLVLLTLVATACTATPEGITPSGTPSNAPAAVRTATSPPLLTRDGQFRFVTTLSNELRAEDPATGAVRWTLSHPLLPGATRMHWRILVSNDGSSVYVQSVADGPSPTYLGTRRIDARTGVELANDIKDEIYWYENVVLWTAIVRGNELQMAIERAAAAGAGYRLRTFDPLTLKMLTDKTHPAPPPVPARSESPDCEREADDRSESEPKLCGCA